MKETEKQLEEIKREGRVGKRCRYAFQKPRIQTRILEEILTIQEVAIRRAEKALK